VIIYIYIHVNYELLILCLAALPMFNIFQHTNHSPNLRGSHLRTLRLAAIASCAIGETGIADTEENVLPELGWSGWIWMDLEFF
jgi:hypothetical protein